MALQFGIWWWYTPNNIWGDMQKIKQETEQKQDMKTIPVSKFREIVKWSWKTPQQVWEDLLSRWYTVEWMDKAQQIFESKKPQWTWINTPQEIEEGKWLISNIVWGVAESVSWAAEFVWTSLAMWIWAIAKWLWADKEKVDKLVESYKAEWDTLWGETIWDEDALAYKISKWVADIVQTISATWAIKKVAWWTKVVQKTWEGISKIGNVIKTSLGKAGMWTNTVNKVANMTSKILSSAGDAVLWAEIFNAISEWEQATIWELVTAAAIWSAFPIAWVAKDWLASKISSIWGKIFTRAIKLNPSDIKKITKPNVAWEAPADWLIKKNIKWSYNSMIKQLDDLADDAYNKINQQANSIAWKYKSEPANKILTAIKKKVSWVEWLEEVAWNVDDLLAKNAKKWLSLKDMLWVKRLLDKRINLYSKSWDPLAQETAEWLRNLRTQLWNQMEEIEWAAGNTVLKSLSKDVQVATEISEAMKKVANRVASNRAIWLTDLLVWGTIWWWVYAAEKDPMKSLFTIAGIITGKKIVESTALRTKIWSVLVKSFNKEQQNIIKDALAFGSKITPEIKAKIAKLLKPIIAAEWADLLSE